ncbi:pyridoxal 5'-phosphate synthase glutaminase subunit PdxT [Rhabdothermincola salaria]|uniref:pyridoxal 5'-phosphate synthase glutaminase subunit PdxT n=1 Tax=Rhabdothermincola salaria TaxID=2903142 RepID=UPI001E615E08|nr:pyridoxal 5'-phosphate synthase glutaminase subunit PdxT [Rhabdothermincola salaria]
MPAVVGVLALQGAVGLHARALQRLGSSVREVRTAADLDAVDALVVPGGESTTMSKLLEANGLFDPLATRLAEGMPALGTCAGMILLAADVLDGRADQRCLGAIDIDVRRNAFGRQVDSFETDLQVIGLDEAPVHAVFIRAPVVDRVGSEVEVLAEVETRPVACRQGPVMVTAFHPELSSDLRIHELFVSRVLAA